VALHPDDRSILVDITYRYARAIDTHDWDLFRTLFTDDCLVDYGIKPVHGCEAFLKMARLTVESLDATQHLFSNHEIDGEGDRASGRYYMTAHHIRRDAAEGSIYTLGGIYEDEFVRTSDGWRISARRYRAIWGRGNAALLGNRFVCDGP
jgi:3-phenylpropionate/cinnamic acid dioxygenase small subunit